MKKIISLVLVAIMVLTMCVPAFATDATPTVSASNGTVGKDNRVTIDITMANNPGLIDYFFLIAYPKCLSIKSNDDITTGDGGVPFGSNLLAGEKTSDDLFTDIQNLYDEKNGTGAFANTYGEFGTDLLGHKVVRSNDDLENCYNDGLIESITFTYDETENTAAATTLPIYVMYYYNDIDPEDIWSDFQADGKVMVKFATVDGSVTVPSNEVAYKANIDIAGDIGLNTRIENIPAEDINNYSAKAYIDGAETGSDLALTKDGDDALVATLRFPAAEMTTPVKVEIYKDAELEKTFNTSVKDMCESYVALYKDNKDQTYTIAKVAAAMLVYGSKAQQYFNVRTDDLADSNTALIGGITEMFVLDQPSDEAKCIVTDNSNGAKLLGASMVLLENLDVKVYIETKDAISGYTATVNGKTADIVHDNDNFYYVRVKDLSPEDLYGQTITVNFTNTSTSVTSSYEFDFLSYCVSCINSGNAKLSAVGISLFHYVLYAGMYASFNK